jgi:ribosomal-protein-alanine N-acetyltransferase
VAYVVAHRTPDEIEILSLGTVAQAQRQGYASRVLAALLEKAGRARIVLEVAADNEAAIRLYKGHGFCEGGRRPNYYRREGNACDAVMMHYP